MKCHVRTCDNDATVSAAVACAADSRHNTVLHYCLHCWDRLYPGILTDDIYCSKDNLMCTGRLAYSEPIHISVVYTPSDMEDYKNMLAQL